MTVSDADRERVIALLREQAGLGTLDLDEFGVRLGEAYQATTVEDLQHSLRELPVAAPFARPEPPRPVATSEPPRPPRPRSDGHQHPHPHKQMSPAKAEAAARAAWGAHLGAYLSVNAMLVVIWLLTGAGYPWPIWPAMGWGIGLASHGMAHSAAMRSRHRRELSP
jgi:hypothetical protein